MTESPTPQPSAESPILSLDGDGALTAEAVARDGHGASVILPAGTIVLLGDDENGFDLPSAGVAVSVSVAAFDAQAAPVPGPLSPLGGYAVTVTVDGVETNAEFVSPAPSDVPLAALPVAARLIVTVSKDQISAAGMGMLYRLSATDPPARVGTSPVIGDPELHFPLPGSGRYAAGGAEPQPAPRALPEGTYRSMFSIPRAECVTVVGGTSEVCGASTIDVVEIFEPSTGEWLGACRFDNSDLVATPLWPDGSQFWCQRQEDAALVTVVTVAANVANLPVLRASQIRQSDGLSMQEVSNVPADGGLQLPDGGSTRDPYDDTSLPFAGSMVLTFTATGADTFADFKRDAVNAVRAAGYEAYSVRWVRTSNGYLGNFSAIGDRDGRKKIGERALSEETWQVVAEETRGNRGTFHKGDDYRVEHGSGAFVLRGDKCGGYAGPWEIAITGDPSPLVDVSGSITFDLNDEATGAANIQFEMKSTINVGPRTIVSRYATEATADVELVPTADRSLLRFSNVRQRVTAGGTDGQINIEIERELNGEDGGLPVERGSFCSTEE